MARGIKKGCNAFDDVDCSTSKPVEEFNCSSNNRGQRDLTLNALVSNYIEKPRNGMKRYLRYYVQHTLKDAIEIAARCKLYNGKYHRHQRRIKKFLLNESATKLLGIQDKIKMCRDFEDLRSLVDNTIRVKGIGDLTIYDISLRIGAKLGLYPQAIYLQAGVISGAKALGIYHKRESIPIKHIRIEHIPKPISSRLEPHEIEDFLCICKGELGDISLKNT